MNRDMRFGLILAEIALLILLLANVYQLYLGHDQLTRVVNSQKNSDEQIAKIDSQLDSLATGTRQLANSGNANAAKILNVLAQNGVSIKGKDAK